MRSSDVNRLLVLTSRFDPGPEALRETAAILGRGPDWDRLRARANEEGALPLLYRNLQRSGDAVPAAVLAWLRAGYLGNLARNSRIYRGLEPFLEAVRRKELRAALTKGSRLALTLYPDIALRSFWDVDVIVHPADWPAVRTVIAELGYLEASGDARLFDPEDATLHWAYSPYFKKDGIFLELHFNFPGLHFPRPTPEDVWASTRRTPVGQTEALVLSPEHEFCHLCLHAQQHSYHKLLWLTDIAELAVQEGLDWDRIRAVCRGSGIGAPVFHALRLVNALWPGTLPGGLIDGFRPGPGPRAGLRFLWPERAVAGRTLSFAWPYYMPSLFSLWERKDPGLAWRTLSGILFPPRAWMAQSPGATGRFPGVYGRYAGRIFRPLFMTVKRMVTKI